MLAEVFYAISVDTSNFKVIKDKIIMDKLRRIENECCILLPAFYKDFYDFCSFAIPDNLVGTDLINNYSYHDLRNGADRLLEEDGVGNFLKSDDFVFMMHQGYMFWYFKATDDPDPIVYGCYEGNLKPDDFGRISDFIKDYTS